MSGRLPVVAIVGRPNVGKSTLFNALIGRRKAIISDIPGTTRDSLMEKVEDLGDIPFFLVDTAGLSDFEAHTLEEEVQKQAELALQNADLILWVIDGSKPLTQDDYAVAEKLRPHQQKVLFCANKVDDGNALRAYEYAELGFGIPEIISAKNNFGFWEFVEVLQDRLKALGFTPPAPEEAALEDAPPKIAIIGRPNVGKSTLLNRLCGQQRCTVSEIPGTTRDAVDILVEYEGKPYIFIDTAGVRRRGKIKDLEFWSFVRTNQAIEEADICILLIDALEGVTHQDLVLAGKVIEAGKGLILGVNKFDLAQEKSRAQEETDTRELAEVPMWDEAIERIRDNYLHYLRQKISFIPWAPVLFFSGKTGKGVQKIFESVEGIMQERKKRIPTHELNLFAKDIYYGHVAPSQGTKRGKIKYVTQVDTAPPKFIFFVNNKEAFHFSYYRYIENKLREKYHFFGTPIKIELRDAMHYVEEKSAEDKK